MTAEFVTRSAQPGDICILLRPVVFENKVIRKHQAALQAIFGGQVTEDLHLTCQRFEVASPETLSALTADLQTVAKATAPIPLMATHVVPFYSRFRKGHLLKIGITVTAELRNFTSALQVRMEAHGIESLYRAQSQTTLVTALDHIERFSDGTSFQKLLPFHLFTARQISISRIKGFEDYELLDTIFLG